MYTTLIDAAALAAHPRPHLRVFDCRFDLLEPQAGAARFKAGHIPDAAYLHLDRDLSATVVPGRTGRHPLPERNAFRDVLLRHGVDSDTQLVAYDDSGGLFAARLWWMARWAGHDAAAVLDGGYQAWLANGGDFINAAPAGAQTKPAGKAPPGVREPVSMQEVRANLEARVWTLLDARAEDRFQGRNETIDAKAGHIPGALNAPFQDNLRADGGFHDRATLSARFEALLAAGGDRPAVCYCGSGVSAAHNILAMVHAGLEEPALYPGSFSEWITDPANPVAGDTR